MRDCKSRTRILIGLIGLGLCLWIVLGAAIVGVRVRHGSRRAAAPTTSAAVTPLKGASARTVFVVEGWSPSASATPLEGVLGTAWLPSATATRIPSPTGMAAPAVVITLAPSATPVASATRIPQIGRAHV